MEKSLSHLEASSPPALVSESPKILINPQFDAKPPPIVHAFPSFG